MPDRRVADEGERRVEPRIRVETVGPGGYRTRRSTVDLRSRAAGCAHHLSERRASTLSGIPRSSGYCPRDESDAVRDHRAAVGDGLTPRRRGRWIAGSARSGRLAFGVPLQRRDRLPRGCATSVPRMMGGGARRLDRRGWGTSRQRRQRVRGWLRARRGVLGVRRRHGRNRRWPDRSLGRRGVQRSTTDPRHRSPRRA